MPHLIVSSVLRDDLESKGFDTSNIADSDMETLARKMSDDYCEQLYWTSMEIIAEDYCNMVKHICPKCGKKAYSHDGRSKRNICGKCGHEWILAEPTGQYVLVQFPEDSSFFEENNIGYDCFKSEDNEARYVPEHWYKAHFEKEPEAKKLMLSVQWPESQKYLELRNKKKNTAALCVENPG